MTGLFWVRIGAISGALAVGIGAFGAHGLKRKVSEAALAVFETGVRYHMYHALALVGLGLVVVVARPSPLASRLAGWGFLLGTILFSGSLYAWALTGARWLVALTPIGGLAFIVGWVALATAASGAARADLSTPGSKAREGVAAPVEPAGAWVDSPSTGEESP
jgi:uncharacterized membrane protein YgdD (TMEM256/DUF423 family)